MTTPDDPRTTAAWAMLVPCATWERKESAQAAADWLKSVVTAVPASVPLPVFQSACGQLRQSWTDYSPPQAEHVRRKVGVIQRELAAGRGGVPALPSGVRTITREEAPAVMAASYAAVADTEFGRARARRRGLADG